MQRLNEWYRLPTPMERLIARLFYALTLTIVLGLALLLLLSPWLPLSLSGDFCDRAYRLFGTDAIVRRTAVISAVGLWVTSMTFFRPARKKLFLRHP